MWRLILVSFVIFLVGCSGTSKEKHDITTIEPKVVDTIQLLPKVENGLTKAELDSIYRLHKTLDSVKILNVFKNLKQIALQNSEKLSFEIINDTVKIITFKTKKKYAFIRYTVHSPEEPYDFQIGFYELKRGNIKCIFEERWDDMSYIGDTIRDVNGDGYKDVITIRYSSSGCCRRNEHTVRLFNNKRKIFEAPLRFMNPTFFPKEGIVRGVKYGHSGEVPLYKMKWYGMKVDTIEYVYPLPGRKDTFLITKERSYKPKEGKLVSPLPKEYRKIESLDWFLKY